MSYVILVCVIGIAFLNNSFNIYSEVKAQAQSITPVTIEIPKGAQNPSNNQFYIPAAAKIFTGAQVTWINNDSVQHTATAEDSSFDTGL